MDEHGLVTITDRKKDILVLASGKNVAPQPIEIILKRAPLIQEIVLLEDSGSVAALVAPDFAALGLWAKQQGIANTSQADLAARPETRKEIRSQIEALSGHLAEFERVRKIAVLDHALSVESGEMTPTLKVRRKVVREKYGYMLN